MDNLPCPKCQGSGFLGEIRGGGETARVMCDCLERRTLNYLNWHSRRADSPQDRPEHPDPPDNPTAPPAIEQRPDFAANPAIVVEYSPIKLNIQRIAPAYEFFLLTIADPAGYESRWLIPGAEAVGPAELDALLRAHEQMKTEEVNQ